MSKVVKSSMVEVQFGSSSLKLQTSHGTKKIELVMNVWESTSQRDGRAHSSSHTLSLTELSELIEALKEARKSAIPTPTSYPDMGGK